ncbi:MAG TPA: hypothetical protein PLL77_14365 [Pyrinomonadaceae bacterium]|nr:hypothetical protein [Pyrinomonadaceae bacterium]
MNLAEILDREFAKARAAGLVIKRSVLAEAQFLKISGPYLSRLRNQKVPLTRDIAEKIAEGFKEFREPAELLSEFEGLVGVKNAFPKAQKSERLDLKYSINEAAKLFDKLSRPGGLLCVDYRDLPQATKDGAYPKLAERANEAVKAGLCFAMFQPFGSVESINTLITKLASDGNIKKDGAAAALDFANYLKRLAEEVREVYKIMAADTVGHLGNIVLFEADRTHPITTATGFQSRIFWTNYFDGEKHQKQLFEWVTCPNNEHFFVERSKDVLGYEAVRFQFHPIPEHWEDTGELPRKKADLDKAYAKYKMSALFPERFLKWKIWPEDKTD